MTTQILTSTNQIPQRLQFDAGDSHRLQLPRRM
jgi:hypothetical protein